MITVIKIHPWAINNKETILHTHTHVCTHTHTPNETGLSFITTVVTPISIGMFFLDCKDTIYNFFFNPFVVSTSPVNQRSSVKTPLYFYFSLLINKSLLVVNKKEYNRMDFDGVLNVLSKKPNEVF